MGFLQDWLRKLREGQKPETTEQLHDDRTQDRELLLLRREHRTMNDEEEKAFLKEKLRERYQQRTSQFVLGIKEGPLKKEGIIKPLKKKKIESHYFNKYHF